jgi:protein gp37
VPGHPFEQGFDLLLVPEKLDAPLRWRRPRQVFVNSMSDLFHEKVEETYIIRVAETMMTATQHTYQVLTKRSARMRDLLNSKLGFAAHASHIWWGVSVEDRKYGVPRIEHLREADVAVRFVSAEPLLGDIGDINLNDIDWVIVGGESGAQARQFDLDWARAIAEQCKRQHVACFIKQLGRRPVENSTRLKLVSGKGGDWNEWPEDLRIREYPSISTLSIAPEIDG